MDELQNYKTVFVVGNGFDLNLGWTNWPPISPKGCNTA